VCIGSLLKLDLSIIYTIPIIQIMENSMSTARKLPSDGSFNEQQQYVNGLKSVTDDDELNRTVLGIKAKATPFEVDAASIPSHLGVKVFHHAVAEEGVVDSDDEENDEQSSTAVVTRMLSISNRQKSEKMVMRFPGTDGLTIKVKFNPDGSIVAHRKETPMSEIEKGLLLDNGNKQAGIVVEATDTNTQASRYTAYTKR
jgi:hypothetical protein